VLCSTCLSDFDLMVRRENLSGAQWVQDPDLAFVPTTRNPMLKMCEESMEQVAVPVTPSAKRRSAFM